MMDRKPELVERLQDFCGKIVPIEVLEGRGYVHASGNDEVDIKFPSLPNAELVTEEPSIDVIDDEEEDVTVDDECVIDASSVYKYIAANVITDKNNYWIKAIPANPEDVQNQEVYMVIVLEGDDVENGFQIKNVKVFARMVEQMFGGMMSIPGDMTLDSHFFEMNMVPPELRMELNNLVKGRYLPEGFDIIGKPMPSNTDEFNDKPPFSAAGNSGIRNVYWDNCITVDDSNIITDVQIDAYEREVSMFQRPHPMNSCYYDHLEAILYIVDQYTDDEWDSILTQ